MEFPEYPPQSSRGRLLVEGETQGKSHPKVMSKEEQLVEYHYPFSSRRVDVLIPEERTPAKESLEKGLLDQPEASGDKVAMAPSGWK